MAPATPHSGESFLVNVPESFGLVSSRKSFWLACTVMLAVSRALSNALTLFTATEPPMASPSISGVTDLDTSNVWMSSEGITSRATERTPDSGEGIFKPLMVTLFKLGSIPRMPTKRPSPWSRSIDKPGKRCNDSAAFWSGNCPIASADTIDEIRSDVRCWFMALAWPLRWPRTKISSMVSPLPNSTAARAMPLSVTFIACVTVSSPR